MLLTCTKDVDASAETVFACVDEPEHIVKWVGGAVSHAYATERNPDNPVGQKFVQKLRMGNSVNEFNGEIIAWEAPTHFGLSIPTRAYSSEAHFRISPKGPLKSTIDYSIDVTLHTLTARVIGTVLQIPLGFFVRNQIGQLKAYAEKLQKSRDRGPSMDRDDLPSPAVALRKLRLGDSWTYSVAGSLTPPEGGALALSGEIGVSIVPEALSGRSDQMTIQFSQTFEVVQPNGSKQVMPAPTWMFSFIQDADTADVAIAADNMGPGGAPRIAKAPRIFYPGRWSRETGFDNRLDFDNGDTVRNTLAVTGEEQVETACGTFLAWKSEITSESVALGRIEGVDWWTPELGAPVRFSTNAGMPDGSRMRFVATLSDSNVLTD